MYIYVYVPVSETSCIIPSHLSDTIRWMAQLQPRRMGAAEEVGLPGACYECIISQRKLSTNIIHNSPLTHNSITVHKSLWDPNVQYNQYDTLRYSSIIFHTTNWRASLEDGHSPAPWLAASEA